MARAREWASARNLFRLREVLVTAELVPHLLAAGRPDWEITDGLPAGAELVTVRLDPDGVVHLVFRHPSFDVVLIGTAIPEHPIAVRRADAADVPVVVTS